MKETRVETIMELYHKTNNFGRLLNMAPEIHEAGTAVYTMEIKEKHLATPKAAHGGVIAALIDGSLGVAALSKTVQDNNVVSTVEMKVNFLKPAILGDRLTATAKVISSGKRLLFVECEVLNQRDELVAKANGTFNAYPAEKVFDS
jgi:acyl-CoA thioesterase